MYFLLETQALIGLLDFIGIQNLWSHQISYSNKYSKKLVVLEKLKIAVNFSKPFILYAFTSTVKHKLISLFLYMIQCI